MRRSKQENISIEDALIAILSKQARKKRKTLEKFVQERLRLRDKEEKQRQAELIRRKEAWHAWFDGAAEPTNPGPRGIGGLLLSPDRTERIEISRAIGYGTNNEAEYTALIAVLEAAVEKDVQHLIVHGDSALVVNQVAGYWKVSSPNLYDLHQRCQVLRKKFRTCELRWIPRDQNNTADALSKKALLLDSTDWGNQTEVGKELGISAVAVGKLLKDLGLRSSDGNATEQALVKGLARLWENKFGVKVQWHIEKTASILAQTIKDRG